MQQYWYRLCQRHLIGNLWSAFNIINTSQYRQSQPDFNSRTTLMTGYGLLVVDLSHHASLSTHSSSFVLLGCVRWPPGSLPEALMCFGIYLNLSYYNHFPTPDPVQAVFWRGSCTLFVIGNPLEQTSARALHTGVQLTPLNRASNRFRPLFTFWRAHWMPWLYYMLYLI